jgi:hypothetical protein
VTATTSVDSSSPKNAWRALQRPESVSPPARAPPPEPVEGQRDGGPEDASLVTGTVGRRRACSDSAQ